MLSCPFVASIVKTAMQTISKAAAGICENGLFFILGEEGVSNNAGILGCSHCRAWLWSRGLTADAVVFSFTL